jgi:hypothetical protein
MRILSANKTDPLSISSFYVRVSSRKTCDVYTSPLNQPTRHWHRDSLQSTSQNIMGSGPTKITNDDEQPEAGHSLTPHKLSAKFNCLIHSPSEISQQTTSCTGTHGLNKKVAAFKQKEGEWFLWWDFCGRGCRMPKRQTFCEYLHR